MKILTKKKEKAILREECFSLDYSLIQWLNSHLKQYLEDADKEVDLDAVTYRYKKHKYTQRELVNRLISITNVLSDNMVYFGYNEDATPDIAIQLKDEMYDILKLIHFSLWW